MSGLHDGDVGKYQSETCDIGWRNDSRIVENERSGVNRGAFCSVKICQDVLDFAVKEGDSEQEALQNGIEVKSVEFVKKGAEVYHKA